MSPHEFGIGGSYLERIAGSPEDETPRDVFYEVELAGLKRDPDPLAYFVLDNLVSCLLVSGLQNSHCNLPSLVVTGDQLLLVLS